MPPSAASFSNHRERVVLGMYSYRRLELLHLEIDPNSVFRGLQVAAISSEVLGIEYRAWQPIRRFRPKRQERR